MSREPTLPQIATFLARKGWSERSGKRRLSFTQGEPFQTAEEIGYRIFEHPREGTPFQVVLPVKPDGAVPIRYLTDALGSLASYYEISVSELTAQIEATNVDVLFGMHPHNSLSLSRAHQIVSNLKNLFTHAANAELDPQPYLAGARGHRIVDDVNFGHTVAGSFGFRVECPLSTADRQMELGSPASSPLERRLLERLATGFITVEIAAQIGDVGPICDNYRSGFNANVCDAIAALCVPEVTEAFTFKFQWASLFPLRENLRDKPSSFTLSPRKYAIVQQASDVLKTMAVKPKTKVVGTVVGLNSDVPPLQMGLLAHRKVTLLVSGGEYEGLKMQLDVSDADYRLAFAAHGEGRPLSVNGTPTQRATHWRIEDHEGLSPL